MYINNIAINRVDVIWERGTGNVLYNGTGTSYNHTNLEAETKYYYAAWSWNDTDQVYNPTNVFDEATTEPE